MYDYFLINQGFPHKNEPFFPVGRVMRRHTARFIRSDTPRADAQPILSGRKHHAPTHSPFYQVENATHRRAAHFTRSEASRTDA